MIYIYKDKKTETFYYQILLDDLSTGKVKKYKKRGFATELEAQKAAYKYVSSEKTQEFNGVTFDFIIDSFLKFKSTRVCDRSIHKLEGLLNKFILPYVKGLYMNKYSPLEAEEFYNKLLKLNIAPDYMNTVLTLMKRIFKYAQDYYGLQNNPVARLEYRKFVIKPIDPQEVYTIEDFNKYIEAYSETMGDYEYSIKLFFTVLMFTGIRRGEGKALRWNDIDFSNRIIRIDEQAIDKDRNYRVLLTKTLKNPQSYRKIPIDDITLSMLNSLFSKRSIDPNFSIDDLIFVRNNALKLPFADSTIYNRNIKAAKTSKVKYLNIHGFRHSYASLMLSMGVPIKAVSEALGHSSIGVTDRVYTHAINRDREKLLYALNNLRGK